VILDFGSYTDFLTSKDGREPFRGPPSLCHVVDLRQRLKGDRRGSVFGQGPTKIVPVALHCERRGTDGCTKVEGKNLRVCIPTKLQRHQCQQNRLSSARWPYNKGMADVADVEREPKGRGAFRLGKEERWCIKVLVALGPRPYGRERDHVREIQCGNRRLTHVGVGVAWQGPQPGVDGVDRLNHAGEIPALDDLLDQPKLFVRSAEILVPHGHRRGAESLSGDVGTEFLQGCISVDRLVVGVRIQKRRRLVGHDLFQDRGDRLSLGEPLPADLGDELRGVGLVEENCPGRPAVREGETIEFVQDPGGCGGREANDRENAQIGVAQSRLEATC
jgi:hypothetical protein